MKDKKIKKENEVVHYDLSQEEQIGFVESNKYFIPMAKVNEDSNVSYIGYCTENECLVIQYKEMKYSVEGFELGLRDEPIAYWYHNVHKLVYNNLFESKNKSKFINKYIKSNYPYHREAIGVDLPLMMIQ